MKRLLPIFTLLMILSCSSPKGTEEYAKKIFNEGVSLSLDAVDAFARGDYAHSEELNKKAIEKFIETIKIDSTHKIASGALGHSYYLTRNFDEATKWFEKAIMIDSSVAVNYREYGLCKINHGDISGGIKEIKKAFQIDNSEEMKQMTVSDLMDIGYLAFDYGNSYEEQGEKETGMNYKQFSVYVLISAHEIDSTNTEIVQSIVDYAKLIDETKIVEKYSCYVE